MDILLKAFVNDCLNKFNYQKLKELEEFLEFEDEIILNYYNFNKIDKNIDKNPVSKIFKNFKI